jgi:peptide deformylase
MLEIVRYPDPFLREVSEPIAVIDDDIRRLAEEMIETMYANNGVGLAAPQVGVHKRICIIDMDPENGDPHVLINPVIVSKSKEKMTDSEGCLSVPGISAKVTRPRKVTMQAQNLDGELVEYTAEGNILSQAFQHEIDHLDGVLFIDKVSIAAKFSIRNELARLETSYEALRNEG